MHYIEQLQRRVTPKLFLLPTVDDEDEGEWSAADSVSGTDDAASWMSSESDAFSPDEEDDEPAIRRQKKVSAAKPPRAAPSAVPPKTPSTAPKTNSSSSGLGNTGNTSVASYTPNQSQPTVTSFSPIGNYASGEDTGRQDTSIPFILPEGVSALGLHEHDQWPFYVKLKDKSGVPRGDPSYNPRTW